MGFDRRQGSGAPPGAQPAAPAPGPGKQPLVPVDLGGPARDREGPVAPGKQPLVPDVGASGAPLQGEAPAGDDDASPLSAGAGTAAARIEKVAASDAAGTVDTSVAPPIQKAPARPANKDYIPIKIAVARPMTRAEFEAAANLQVFGSATVPGHWQNVADSYTPEQSPVEVLFEASLIRRMRGKANAAKGIDTDATGAIAGADDRATDFHARPATDEKAALLAEIDRRYDATRADAPGAKIKPGESGKSDLWRMLRDEVLFQHHHLANLPDNVKALIHTSIKGRDLTPTDYDQLFRIAKKIEALPPGAAADYGSKVTAATSDLAAFDTALESYRADLAARAQADTARTAVQNKLLGLEEVYRLYRDHRTTPIEAAPPGTREHLEQQLSRNGFASIADFASYVARFEQAFEQGAVRITLDLLARYAGKLHREAQRYQDPTVVADLHGKLAGFRTQHDAFDDNTRIYSEELSNAQHERGAEQRRLPGNGGIPARPPTQRQFQAQANITAARAGAEAQIKDLSKDHPIFAEDDLPVDRRIDKVALARASDTQLAGVLQSHIAHRNAAVADARAELEGNHALIYKMDKLMPAFYADMDIQPGSIHDQIIKDKLHDDAIAHLAGGIVLAIAAIALTVVSLGTATPAIIAAGASIGAAGLSTYMAYDEYKQYAANHALADAGFADDPSVVWLVLAIAGAGVDMAAATKAIGKLASSARLLKPGDDIADFTSAVRRLQESKEIDDKIAAAATNAAAARQSYATARGELSTALAKAYSFPGPLTDPDVYRALVKMAAAKIKEGSHSLAGFIAELKQARITAHLAELSPEELARAKDAWARAESLARLVNDPILLEKLLSKVTDDAALERLLAVFPPGELEVIVDALKNADQLAVMLDHVGTESTRRMIRHWIAEGQIEKANRFLDRLSAGLTRELAETAEVGAQSIIIDSNTAIALMKDADPALRATMQAGEQARVAYIKSLPSGTELRVGNVTVGETGSALNLKGVPLDVLRDSPDYLKVLNRLQAENVGKAGGFADQALVADAFFARTEPGVIPRFLTSDQVAVKKLASIANINLVKEGGFGGLLKKYGSSGFNVTIDARTITVIPVQ